MPKKKKKSRASGDATTVRTSAGPPATSIKEGTIEDYAVVQIMSSSTPPVKTLRYTPMIILTVDDADRLGVIAGDSVFLLSVQENNELEAASTARVFVSSPSTGASSIKSPPRLAKTQRSKLSPGYCHVFPVSLARRLQGQVIVNEEEIDISSPSTPAPISTPSPSKAKFSFAKGGGGDRMIASPSTPQTPQNNTKLGQPKSTSKMVWIVPVECDLGDLVSRQLCREAGEIQIQTDSSTLQTFSSTSSFGSLLIRAHLLNSFVSIDTSVSVSVQGNMATCILTNVKAAETQDQLEGSMAKMSLEEDGTDDSHAQEILTAVQRATDTRAHLYQITLATNIVVDNAHADGDSSPEKGISNEPPPSLLAGLDETIVQVTDLLLTPIRHPELFQRSSSIRPPKGVLLHGSTGSGKSTLAKQVAEILKFYHKIQVCEISCSKLQSQTAVVGQAEQGLVRQFESAAKSSKGPASLVILDDVHLICPRRQGMNAGADRLAATLLALLDGVDTPVATQRVAYHPVVVLAVTSNPSLLDPALRRPGRLDTEVEVPLPDEPSVRSQILKFHFNSLGSKVEIAEASDEWIRLARLAKGFTGADLQLAVKEATRSCILRPASSDAPSERIVSVLDLEMAIRSIKPSAIKAVTVEIPQVHWSSIGGMDEVKRQLREAIELPLTHGAIFKQLGIRPPRGVLLYGPPGCSKTLMARALATEGHMNFLAVKGPELLSKWLGESERALASLFRRARLASPSVIFFDEVDAIATKRGGGNSGGGERLLSQLLTELDGIQSGDGSETKQRVVVVCATNRPDLLDSALMRPGRIDRMIHVGVPDQESRRRILEIGLKDKACEADVDVSFVIED